MVLRPPRVASVAYMGVISGSDLKSFVSSTPISSAGALDFFRLWSCHSLPVGLSVVALESCLQGSPFCPRILGGFASELGGFPVLTQREEASSGLRRQYAFLESSGARAILCTCPWFVQRLTTSSFGRQTALELPGSVPKELLMVLLVRRHISPWSS